ncbi:MAG: agmatinase [Chloroflexi bacterium]|nr:agmatinase [Chloroflexota bacterium]
MTRPMKPPQAPGLGLPLSPFTFLGLEADGNTYHQAATVVLPVPYDGTASFKSGAREGPDAIISASRELEEYDAELQRDPCSMGIHTASAVEPHMGSPEKMVARVAQAVAPAAEERKLVATLGGDHSVSIGAVRAFASQHSDLSVLYLDAHADLRQEYLGTAWGHASAARRISEMCPLVLVGVRSMSREEAEFIEGSKTPCFPYAGDEGALPVEDVIGTLSPSVYISMDLDVFDPSFMAAVGTPVPGGMGWYQVLHLLRQVASARRIVGFDVVELSPREGPAACAFTAAALVYKLIGYGIALGPGARR